MPDMTIRWMLGIDLPRVVHIERASFPEPWTVQHFADALATRNVAGMVAEVGHPRTRGGIVRAGTGVIAGFMIYSFADHGAELMNIAVDPEHRRAGAGRAMLEHLKGKAGGRRPLSPKGKKPAPESRPNDVNVNRVVAVVRETNVPAQLLFRACGFEAVAPVLREHFVWEGADGEVMAEDGYLFRWCPKTPVTAGTAAGGEGGAKGELPASERLDNPRNRIARYVEE